MKDSINYSGFLDIINDASGEVVSEDSKLKPILSESPLEASISETSSRRPSMNDLGNTKRFWAPD